MAIICLEGASGIGKSTAADFMEKEYGYVRVPEVNELFERSSNESVDWYFEMQIKRWELAKNESQSGKVAILDGDHLQPIWYNWIFDDLNFQPVNEVLDFYSKAFLQGQLDFPDAYVLLHIGLDELRARKENDKRRKRSNFEMHLRLIEPQREYFESLRLGGHRGVSFVQATSPMDIANYCHDLEKADLVNHAKTPGFDIVEAYIKSKSNKKGRERAKERQ
ncbi:chloramphenicol acetyltransferase [Alteromonas flava]|uniref:chloramphenicol acetyltransferase n=1 Tax=Alteromonas flava TaxID=2048003 RepID=UPI000C28F07F|nr:chloramphenicol acetyltransferase [Alteromonas flava]